MTTDRAHRTAESGRWAIAPLVLVALTACGDPADFLPAEGFGAPAGVLDGTVTYSGPAPCTEGGQILGAAVLFAFDVNLLPPPEGLGTSAASLAVVPGSTLFGGVRDRLTFDPGGKRVCPDPKAPPITVSADWTLAPLSAAVYEVRGFYDLDGEFDPSFKIANLPNKGDIGGGAIDNAADVLMGKPPVYRRIRLGAADANGTLTIPSTGARVDGIAVTLGLALPLDRPVFYPKKVLDTTTAKNTDPNHVVMPADFQLKSFSASPSTENSFIRYDFGIDVAPSEIATAAKPPFDIAAPAGFQFTRQAAHVPDSALLPSLYPLAIFTLLESGSLLVNQSPRVVVLQGITLYKSLLNTVIAPTTLNDTQPDVIVALRPAVLCLDTSAPTTHGVLLATHDKDSMGNPVLADPMSTKTALEAQFGRTIDIQYGCLPEGQYAANLIYGTGQAWTVPNEAGVCQAGEAPSADGKTCGTRPRLASQGVSLTIGPASNPDYCKGQGAMPAVCLP